MAKTIEQRETIAEAVAQALTAADGSLTYRAWRGGEKVRVYVRKGGSERGHLTVDGDGDVLLRDARGMQHIHTRAIEAACQAHGTSVYSH